MLVRFLINFWLLFLYVTVFTAFGHIEEFIELNFISVLLKFCKVVLIVSNSKHLFSEKSVLFTLISSV